MSVAERDTSGYELGCIPRSLPFSPCCFSFIRQFLDYDLVSGIYLSTEENMLIHKH